MAVEYEYAKAWVREPEILMVRCIIPNMHFFNIPSHLTHVL
jgi:hypothetical protein